MSETDDTDDLLLIPPDLFVVDSEREDSIFNEKSLAPYYTVVDSLIEQVNNLEDRLNCLQSTSDISLINSIDSNTNYMSEPRRFNSFEDLHAYYGSAQSTPQKPRNKFHLQSLPNSPNTKFSPGKPNESKSPQKRLIKRPQVTKNSKTDLHYGTNSQNEILEEIDNFISNVKTIQRINAVRNLSFEFEKSKSKNELKSNDSLFNNTSSDRASLQSATTEDVISKQKTWQPGETIYSVPDCGSGMRDIMYSNKNQPITEGITMITVTPLDSQPTSFSNSVANEEVSTTISTDSIPTTALYMNKAAGDAPSNTDLTKQEDLHAKAKSVIDLHKKFMSEATVQQQNMKKNSLGLISLTELWSKSKQAVGDNINYAQKLEEEKLRRQHCEQLINKLQSRVLELQERLAVAVQVDQTKDDALFHFQEKWEQVGLKLKSLTEEKANIEKQLIEIKEQKNKAFEEAVQRAQHYESEVSKALNLAHSNQEKCSSLESLSADLRSKIKLLENVLEEKQSVFTCETQKNQQLSELLAQKEIELNESKNVVNNARMEIAESKKAVEICQNELTSMKNECSQLKAKLNEERERSANIEKQKKKLQFEIESHKKIERDLQEELNKAREACDQNKIELRNFYQDQVEAVVKEKLQEFQLQLDKAESALQEELKNRELMIARRAVDYIQQLLKKHTLEVQLLEEKHREEIRLYQVKLSQNQQQIEALQMKFQEQQERRAIIAQQLQKVMEQQWMEAIRIINTTRSPVSTQNVDTSTIDQLNSLKSKSYSNFQELLMNIKESKEEATKKQSEDNMFQPIQSESVSSILEDNVGQAEEVPLSSRFQKKIQDQDIEKFIRMLLNKSPGNPVDDQENKIQNQTKPNSSAAWQAPEADEKSSKVAPPKDKKQLKRPWK